MITWFRADSVIVTHFLCLKGHAKTMTVIKTLVINDLVDWHSPCNHRAGTMRVFIVSVLAIASFGVGATPLSQAPGSAQGPVATFKSSIDLVRINAIVRDKKGRFVSDLAATDFEVEDGGVPRKITEFRREEAGISVALLFDVSGSMEDRMKNAREAGTHLLSWLKEDGDEAAVFTFDTELAQVASFQTGMTILPDALSSVKPFGATSLNDAIARTAQKVASREALRRAVPARSMCRFTSSASCLPSITRRPRRR